MTELETRPAALDVTCSRDIQQVDTARWDALLGPRGFYSASPWLRHAQATAVTAPYYFTASQGPELIAALPAYPLAADTPYVFCSPGRVVGAIHQQVTGQSSPWTGELMPALACGGRNPSHTRAGVNGTVPDGLQHEALHAVVAAAEREASSTGLETVSFLYVDEDDTHLRSVLEERQYVSLPGQTAYSLKVPEDGTFTGYLAGLRSRRRTRIRKELQVLAAAGVSYRTQPITEKLIEEVAPLEMELYAKHGTQADAQAFLTVLRSVAANTGDAARITTAHLDGKVIGFVLTFTHGGQIYARQAGFDYEAQGRLPVYFGLVYYELLRVALAEGISHIHYSTGSDTVKLSRGCVPTRQYAYVKSRRPEQTALLSRLAQRCTGDPADTASGSEHADR
ncbi:GNAT family N-acetyltransferase [Streptomyces sp. NPDC086549]|uniref:GNAT family N-acetyltransferase n=1 Tax=Streptomyces sp. NPDC086549 TaxID=3365752 RepID=UPI0038041FE2